MILISIPVVKLINYRLDDGCRMFLADAGLNQQLNLILDFIAKARREGFVRRMMRDHQIIPMLFGSYYTAIKDINPEQGFLYILPRIKNAAITRYFSETS